MDSKKYKIKIKNLISKLKDDPIFGGSLPLSLGVYIFTYLLFFSKGFISPGVGLTKNDWLSFFGSFLCFSGTLYIGYGTLFQTKAITDMSYERLEKERFDRIQPVFVLSVNEVNYTFHKDEKIVSSFDVSLKNLGEFPVLDIWFSHEFICESLSSNEFISFECSVSNSFSSISQTIRKISLNDFKNRNIKQLPSEIEIRYVDIDGHNMVQVFQLCNYIDMNLYSLIFKGTSSTFDGEDESV